MEAASLSNVVAPGRGGRSRFSKALPAPPPSAERGWSLTQHLKSLPLTSAFVIRKKLPSDAANQDSSPPSLPLPASPPKETANSLTMTITEPPTWTDPPSPLLPQGKAPVTQINIPRRPVPVRETVLPPPPASPDLSPTSTVSSVLSAYSYHTSDSTLRSSTGNSSHDAANTKASSVTVMPKVGVDVGNQKPDDAWLADQSLRIRDNELPPATKSMGRNSPQALPIKDADGGAQNQVSPLITSSQTAVGSVTDTLVSKTSTAQSQIWKRRSLNKTESNDAVRELVFTSNNGSAMSLAADSSMASPLSASAHGSLPSPQIPVTSTSTNMTSRPSPPKLGLPGRTVRSVLTTPVSVITNSDAKGANEDSGEMGQGQSDLKQKLHIRRSKDIEPTPAGQHPAHVTHATEKPNDALLSVSRADTSNENSSLKTSETAADGTDPTPSRLQYPDPSQRTSPSSLQLATQARQRLPVGLPKSPTAQREAAGLEVRTTSRAPTQAPPLDTAHKIPEPTSQYPSDVPQGVKVPSPVPAAAGTEAGPSPLFQVEGEAIESLETTDHPAAALFPRGWHAQSPDDSALMGNQMLKSRHFHCYTRHLHGIICRQALCFTCGAKNRPEMYWKCGHCFMQLCRPCKIALDDKCQGDVQQLVKTIGTAQNGSTRRSESIMTTVLAETSMDEMASTLTMKT